MFAIRGETVAFRETTVLHGIDLAIRQGEQLALVGPSGAGKTTLLRRLWEKREDVAFIHQDHALVPQLSVFHNVLIGRLDESPLWRNMLNLVWPLAPELAEIGALLTRLGMAEKLRQPLQTLSGGQRQRVAVARAMYRGTGALLADEPISAADPHLAAEVLNLLKQAFPTLVVSLHSVHLAREHFGRLVGLKAGRIYFDLPSSEVSEVLLAELFQPC